MMNCYGIENIYVTGLGNGGGHAWNMVGMDDGKYYWLDATWDDQPYEQFQHDYFLVGNNNLQIILQILQKEQAQIFYMHYRKPRMKIMCIPRIQAMRKFMKREMLMVIQI